jgi:hypothetical protein
MDRRTAVPDDLTPREVDGEVVGPDDRRNVLS